MSKRKRQAISGRHEPVAHDSWETPAKLKSLEAKLATLQPRHDRLDRDLLIFVAGRASVEDAKAQSCKAVREPILRPGRLRPYLGQWPRSAAFWSRSCAAMTVVAATLLVVLVTRPANEPNPIVSRNEVASTEAEPPAPAVYQTNRRLDPHKLSAVSYHLKQFEHLLASGSFDSQPTESSQNVGSESDWTDRKIMSPTSFHMLLDESSESDAIPFDSSSCTRGLGSFAEWRARCVSFPKLGS